MHDHDAVREDAVHVEHQQPLSRVVEYTTLKIEYQGDPALREETVRALRLAAGWEITRRVRLAAGLDRGERSSTFLDRDYKFTAFMANLRYQF